MARKIMKRYLVGFVSATILTVISWPLAYYIKILWPNDVEFIANLIEPITIILIATSLFGDPGGDIMALGTTGPEKTLNQFIIIALPAASYFLTSLLLFLK